VRRRRTGCSTPAVIADTAKLTGCVLRPGSDVAVLPSNYHSFFCKSGTGPELPTQLPGAAAGVLLIQTHDITQSNHYRSGKPSISGLCSRVCGRVLWSRGDGACGTLSRCAATMLGGIGGAYGLV
jgi:hypothetical protein